DAKLASGPVGSTWLLTQRRTRATSVYGSVRATRMLTSFRVAVSRARAGVRAKKERRGQESNLPRLLRTDNGFEDREDHQAPFTLRKAEEENVQRPTSNYRRRKII